MKAYFSNWDSTFTYYTQKLQHNPVMIINCPSFQKYMKAVKEGDLRVQICGDKK